MNFWALTGFNANKEEIIYQGQLSKSEEGHMSLMQWINGKKKFTIIGKCYKNTESKSKYNLSVFTIEFSHHCYN